MPTRILQPTADQFTETPHTVVMHYYGAGGWGILWRGTYVVMAPYFSNHSIANLAVDAVQADAAAIAAGVKGTPFGQTAALLIGHGHIDHAGDVPTLMATQVVDRPPALIADQSTVQLLHSLRGRFSCVDAIQYGESGQARVRCPLGAPPVARITAVESDHAPHTQIRGIGLAAFVGSHHKPLQRVPDRAKDFVLGQTWAYVVELLDAAGRTVFRIHYVDAAPNAPHGIVDLPAGSTQTIDVHIACVPGHNLVDGYPGELLAKNRVQYVIGGHWEDFFQPQTDRLKPLQFVLDQDSMEAFVDKVEAVVGTQVGPVAPVADPRCQSRGVCGPAGPRWSLPVPGQTLRFAVRQ